MTCVSIHPLADVQTTGIGTRTRVWQCCVVLPGAQIGSECNVCSHVYIENDVVGGDRVTVKCGVQLWDGLRVGYDVFHRVERDVHQRPVPTLEAKLSPGHVDKPSIIGGAQVRWCECVVDTRKV